MEDTNLNLPFELVAVPQHVPTTTSYTTPIKVKIKMKKGENVATARKGVISVPKLKPINPEVTRRVHSDETIMSFNIRMEPENESRPRRKSQNKFFHIFKTGICFDTEDEDENDPPYMLASADKSSETKSQRLSYDKKEKSSTKNSKNKPIPPDNIFGKCKPGGCLDPPFGEDKYQYYRPTKLKQLNGTEVENMKNLSSENAENNVRDKRIAKISVKNREINDSDASSTHMLYKGGSIDDALEDEYSDSIITYPTRTSSRDMISLERSIISKKSSSLKTRQLNMDTYFPPTKLSKSQERKRESVYKRNTDTKDDVKEIIKIEVPSCNIPISKRTGDILLDNKVIHVEPLQTNPPQLKNESNYEVSRLVEVSGNILLTVKNVLEPKVSVTSKAEKIRISEAEEVNGNILDDHENVTQILKSTRAGVTNDEMPSFNKLSSSTEMAVKLQKLNRTPVKTASSIISSEKQILTENDAKYNQIYSGIPKYEERENQLSQVESNKTSSKLMSQENVVKESPILYSSHKPKENASDMPQNMVEEVLSQTHDLNLITVTTPNIEKKEDTNNVINTTQTIEKLSKHDISDHKDLERVKNENIQIQEDLNLDSNKEFDKITTSINSEYNYDHVNDKKLDDHYIPEKLKHSNSYGMPNNNIVDKDNEVQKTKEVKSITNIFTTNDKENMIKDNLLSYAANSSPEITLAKNNVALSLDDTKQESNKNVLQYNDLTTENVPKLNNVIQHNQFQEKERSLSHGNILDNLPPNNESMLIRESLPAIVSTKKYMTTTPDTEIDGSIKTTDNNINTSDTNVILENINTVKQDSTNAGIKTESDDDLPSIDIDPKHRQYAVEDINSTPIIARDKSPDNVVSEKVSEPVKLTISYHDNNEGEIDKNIIPTQKTLSKSRSYEQEHQSTNSTDHNISNKSSFIGSTKYLEINNDLGIPHDTASKENLSTHSRKSFLDNNSSKPPLSTVISVNTITSNDAYLQTTPNATKKEELGEIPHTPDIHYYGNALDSINDEKYDEKIDELVTSNGAKKITSKSTFKPTENNTTIVELGFQTYIDENGDTLLRTFDVHQEPQRFIRDSIFVTKKVLELNDSNLSFAINSDTRLSLKIDKTKTSNERSFKEVSPSNTTQRVGRNNKMRYNASDIGALQESLSAIYENDLVPMEQLIRSLRLEIDRIIQYNHLLRKKSVATIRKVKPTYSKRCVCIRKYNNID